MTYRSHTPSFANPDPAAAKAAIGIVKGQLCTLEVHADYVKSTARILEHIHSEPVRKPWPLSTDEDPHFNSSLIYNVLNIGVSLSPVSYKTTTFTPLFAGVNSTYSDRTLNMFSENSLITLVSQSSGFVFRPGHTQFSYFDYASAIGYSIRMNDSAGMLTFPADFTFEFWVRAYNPNKVILSKSGGLHFDMSTGAFENYGGSSLSFGGLEVCKWTHIAISRSGSVLTAYKDGVLSGTVTYSGTIDFEGAALGLGTSDTTYFDGTIDEIRVTKGIGRYTANFSLGPGSRLEYPNSARDSVVYDPVTDMLFAKIEYYMWAADNSTTLHVRTKLVKIDPRSQLIVASRTLWSLDESDGFLAASPYKDQQLYIIDGELVCRSFLSSITPSEAIDNTHYDVFSTVDLSTVHSYYTPFTGNGPYLKAGSSYFNYAAAGSAVFTADPYYNSVTFLLDSLDIRSRPFKDRFGHTLTSTSGYPTIIASSSNIPSTEFNSLDKITCALSTDFALPGDFTIEFVVSFTGWAVAAPTYIYGPQTPFSMPEANFSIVFHNTGGGTPRSTMTADVFGTTLAYTDPTGNVLKRDNTNYHVAVSRTGSTIRLFLNGALVASGTSSDAGAASSIELGNLFWGKLYEVRVTPGVCRYTTAFTPPWNHSPMTAYVANGVSSPVNTIGLYLKTVVDDRAVFTLTQTSPILPILLQQNTLVYHAATNEVWGFIGPTASINETADTIGIRWNITSNTITPILKQGLFLSPSVANNSIVKLDFNAENSVPIFGSLDNYGLAITATPARSGFTGSLSLPKSNVYGRLPKYTTINSNPVALGTTAWTLDLFYYNPALQAEATPDVLVSEANALPGFEIAVTRSVSNAIISFRAHNGTTTVAVPSLSTPSESLTPGTWVHIALVRNLNKVSGYVDGVLTHELTLSTTTTSMTGSFAKAFIGCSSAKTNFARGNIQQLRISRTALWTAAFTPPTTLTAVGFTKTMFTKPTIIASGDVLIPAAVGETNSPSVFGVQQFNQAGALQGEYGFTHAYALAETSVTATTNVYCASKFEVSESTNQLIGVKSFAPTKYVEIFNIGAYSKQPNRLTYLHGYFAAGSDPFTYPTSTFNLNTSILTSAYGIPANGRAVSPNYASTPPPAITLDVNNVGRLSTDYVAPVAAGRIYAPYKNNLIYPTGSYTGYDNVQWYKFYHDGTKTHMVTLLQPSVSADVIAQSNMIDRLLAIGLYNSTGKLLYRTNNVVNYVASAGSDTMLPISGFNYDVNYLTAAYPFAFPLTVLRSYPPGDYYVAVVNRLSTVEPGAGDQTMVDNHLCFSDVEFDVKQPVIDVNGAYKTYQDKARLSFESAIPFVELYGKIITLVDASGGVDLTRETAAPITGAGSLKLSLSAIGTAPPQTVTFNFNVGLSSGNSDSTVVGTLGKFNTSLGTLTGVALTLTGSVAGSVNIVLSASAPTSKTARGVGSVYYYAYCPAIAALSTILENGGAELVMPQLDTGSVLMVPGTTQVFSPLAGTATATPDCTTIFAALSQAGGGTFDVYADTYSGWGLTGGAYLSLTGNTIAAGFSGSITYTYS